MVFICFLQRSKLRVDRLSSSQTTFPRWVVFDSIKTLSTCFCLVIFHLLCVSLAFRSSQLALKILFHCYTHMYTPTYTQTFSHALYRPWFSVIFVLGWRSCLVCGRDGQCWRRQPKRIQRKCRLLHRWFVSLPFIDLHIMVDFCRCAFYSQ